MNDGWERARFCLTCSVRAPEGCQPGHDVLVVKLLDVAGMWREHNERIRRQHEFEARKLGEAA